MKLWAGGLDFPCIYYVDACFNTVRLVEDQEIKTKQGENVQVLLALLISPCFLFKVKKPSKDLLSLMARRRRR